MYVGNLVNVIETKMSVLRRVILSELSVIKRKFHTGSKLLYYLPKDEKHGRPPVYDRPPDIDTENISTWESIKLGYKFFMEEFAVFRKEMKQMFTEVPLNPLEHNVVDVVWSFDNPSSLDKWVVTADSDHQDGFSQAKLELTKDGKGIFYGMLDVTVPKDGKRKYAGYCNIKTTPIRKSFQRETFLDWSDYTHLVLRVRGDGRMYMVNVGSKQTFNTFWFDLYGYVMYTRGGPYWQYVTIPFSKLVSSNHGQIRDQAIPLELDRISSLSITAADRISGPFKLEIDYIGVTHDEFEPEECAYESYEIRNVIF